MKFAIQQGQTEAVLAAAATLPDSVRKFRLLVNYLISRRQDLPLQKALDYLRTWRQIEPASLEPLLRQLEIHLFCGELERAEKCLEDWAGLQTFVAAQGQSLQAELLYFRGVLEQLRGRTDQAITHYSSAITGQRQATGLVALNEVELAVAAAIQGHETAAGNYPGSPSKSEDGMFGSGPVLQALESALVRWEQLSGTSVLREEVRKAHANAWYNLGCAALADFTFDDRRIALFEKAVALDPEHVLARCNVAFAHNYSASASSEQIFQAHWQVGSWLQSRPGALPASEAGSIPRESGARIRLAYLSSDFRQHSVAHFILPVLAQHDRKRFEVFVYHNHPREDSLTGLARQHADYFHKVSGLNDAELLKQIRGDQIDILVDLNGLTGNHRLAVLSQRAAPVQLNWIGYPNTTGLTTVDYRLTDGLVDPPGQSEEFCTETLLRLHSPFLAYMPPAELPELKPAPRLSNGYITFGSFNALPKLNPALLRSWAAILQQVPESRLLIKNFGMDFKRPKEQVRAIFADQGIGPERLLFVGKTNTQQAHLQFYSQVDICLDTFPYNGTTTSCETLLMGVPLVSWAGHEHRSRVGLTLLSALGLESLVARNENELISVARFLADDANQLQTFRSQLRNNLLNSRLTDAAELTRDLEAKLATIHGACKQQGTT